MSRLDVLYQFDENYAPFAGVSLTTLFKNNQEIEHLTVYLAAVNISDKNRELLDRLAQQYNRELVYIRVEELFREIEKLKMGSWNGSQATWMKMFVMDEIPEKVDKLLYIDSDTLIRGSLMELTELDMGAYPVAAVIDSISPASSERLGLPGPYFNAGVIYFNLKYWREHGIQKHMLEHLKRNISRYPVNDQDLLNDYFNKRIMRMSPCFNFQGIHYIYRDNAYFHILNWPEGCYYDKNEVAKAREDVRIMHFFRFCGEYPWQPGNVHPCKLFYEQERANSLWKEYHCPPKPLKMIYRLERILYRVLPQRMFLRLHVRVSN